MRKSITESLVNCINILLDMNVIGLFEAEALKNKVESGDKKACLQITNYLKSFSRRA